jgi:hypothetical protein
MSPIAGYPNWHFWAQHPMCITLHYNATCFNLLTMTDQKDGSHKKKNKPYQQYVSLALLALGKDKRGLYGSFVTDVFESKGPAYCISFMATPVVIAAKLGKEVLLWIKLKLTTTIDQVFLWCLNFVKLTQMYKLFRVSVQNVNAMLVEYLYKYCIPIWLMTSKHNYVEIALNQIEDFYG